VMFPSSELPNLLGDPLKFSHAVRLPLPDALELRMR
jgi:hypothetical protein